MARRHWSLDDIPWGSFEPAEVDLDRTLQGIEDGANARGFALGTQQDDIAHDRYGAERAGVMSTAQLLFLLRRSSTVD